MTDAKRLLEQATPLPWEGQNVYDRWTGADVWDELEDGDAALIVYAVNHLPDYEAAVDALEGLLGAGEVVNYDDTDTDPGFYEWRRFNSALDDARTALARLRDGVTA